jgi:electron transfer flavoprotein beta subunit
MKAKKKPIDEKTADQYGVDLTPRLEVLKTTEPAGARPASRSRTSLNLSSKLKNEAGVL